MELADWGWPGLSTTVVFGVFVDAGVLSVLAVVFLAVGQRVVGLRVVQSWRRDLDAWTCNVSLVLGNVFFMFY